MGGDWTEYEQYVLRTLERIENTQDKLVEDMAAVKAAAKFYGAVTSLVVTPIIVGVVLAAIAAFK